MQGKGSVEGGGSWGAVIFSECSGGGEDKMGCDDVVDVAEVVVVVVVVVCSDIEPLPRCCDLFERTKLLSAGRIALEI